MIISKQRRRKKKEGEENEYIFHLVSYKWFRRTQYITLIGLFYKNGGDFTWMVVNMDFIVEELVGPETSSSKFRNYCHSRRSNRDVRRLPDCFQVRYQGSNCSDNSMPSPFGQRTGYGPAYFRKLNFRCEYRQSRVCCYLHLYCFGLLRYSSKARFQAYQSSMMYW